MASGSKHVKWSDLVKKKLQVTVGKPKEIVVQKEVIPIVFVPGIMGSRLKKGSEKVWDPDGKGFMLWNYGMAWVDAADKKAALVGDDFDAELLVPYEDDADHNQKFSAGDWGRPSTWPTAEKRGWGTVGWGSYGEILQKLQAPETWPAALHAFFDFPVYAVGYNWSASNVDSGKKLAAKIKHIVGYHQKADGLCEKVIIVTHSMGGLVARWAVDMAGAKDQVLGVIHGVQPAVGAATAYWRMKAGFERGKVAGFELPNPAAWVLGTNGREVTALLGWMPGGLQLLPGPDYTDNTGSKDWLRIIDHEQKEVAAYGADALNQIYTNDDPLAYWRLIEKSYLLPEKKPKTSVSAAWGNFCDVADKARTFHEDIAGKSHPETQAFYGAGKGTPSCDRAEYRAVLYGWKDAAKDAWSISKVVRFVAVPGVGTALALGFEVLKRTEWWQSRGAFKVRAQTRDGGVDMELSHPADVAKRDPSPHGLGAGDGTVAESSGKAVKQRGEAVGSEKEAQAFEGVEHEPAFHADQRGAVEKSKAWAHEKLGGPKSAPPEDNTVTFTVAAVKRLVRVKIKKAK